MLYQENNNRERRLNSKGMTGVEPMKTTMCGKQRQLQKEGKPGSQGKRTKKTVEKQSVS